MKTDFSINVQVNVGVTPEVVQLVMEILQRTPPVLPALPATSEQPATEVSDVSTGQEALTQKKELTEQDVREAMHRARQRIEGEDYKNSPESDGYKKYHKPLTAAFKNIAAFLGSDKPSTLPADKRAIFIQQCDELIVDGGEITTKCPY